MQLKSEKIPVVFINNGNPSYFKYALAQARIFNPDTTIYLIGDISNDKYDFAEHHNIERYHSKAELFSKVYKHHSKNPYRAELFCFNRWFILEEFMVQNNIEKCLYLDSDLLLFTDIQGEYINYLDYGFTLSGGFGPHFNIINNVTILNNFCDFVVKCFTDELLYKKLVKIADEEPWSQGCVSDMVAFYEYQKTTPYSIGDISLLVDQTKHDSNMNLPEGFEMEEGIKKVVWIDNKPYCRNINDGSLIRFNSLHFQGRSKEFIRGHFRGMLHHLKDKNKWSMLNNKEFEEAHGETERIYKLLESEQFDKAGMLVNQLIEKYPDVPDLLNVKGEVMWRSGNIEESAKVFSYTLELQSDHIEALNNLAVLSCYNKNYTEATKLLRKLLRLNPSKKDALENLTFIQNEVLVEQAGSLIEKGFYYDAEAMLKRILNTDAHHVEALYLFSEIHTKNGNFEEAEKLLSLALQLDPENQELKRNLAYVQQQKTE